MKRRILHVLASPHLGGAEWMCLYLAQEQQKRGHDVRVHFFEIGAASARAKELGLDVTIQNVTTYSRSARWEGFAHGLQRELQTYAPQMVHSHVPLTNLICHRIVPRAHLPWVTTMHGSWRQFAYAPQTVKRPYLKPYLLVRHALGDRLATRSASRIIAVCAHTAGDLRRIGIPDSRLTTILNGLPGSPNLLNQAEGRNRLQLPKDAFVIGALGYLAPVKGFDILIRAFSRIAPDHPNTLLVIGGGDVQGETACRDSLQKLISELGLTNRVQLRGPVDPRAGFMITLDVFVVSSRTEGLSLSLVEAMQHGLPSVVTSAGGSAEAARPDQEALVFLSGDIADLGAKLKRLISEPTLRSALGQSARERATSYLTIERCADEYERVYDQVLSTRI